jgi:hypothetical protein
VINIEEGIAMSLTQKFKAFRAEQRNKTNQKLLKRYASLGWELRAIEAVGSAKHPVRFRFAAGIVAKERTEVRNRIEHRGLTIPS